MRKSVFTNDYRVFLEQLRRTREAVGLTQEDLAERLQETQSFVSKAERGERRIDVVELRVWCQALGVPFLDFTKQFDEAIMPPINGES